MCLQVPESQKQTWHRSSLMPLQPNYSSSVSYAHMGYCMMTSAPLQFVLMLRLQHQMSDKSRSQLTHYNNIHSCIINDVLLCRLGCHDSLAQHFSPLKTPHPDLLRTFCPVSKRLPKCSLKAWSPMIPNKHTPSTRKSSGNSK